MADECKEERKLNRLVTSGLWQFGSIWWIGNDRIKEAEPGFNKKDEHIGHPGLSLLKEPPLGIYDAVPLLFGTSCRNNKWVQVKGITAEDPEHLTYFGLIQGSRSPGCYDIQRLTDGAAQESLLRYRSSERIWPNRHKTIVSPDENNRLEAYCRKHKLV